MAKSSTAPEPSGSSACCRRSKKIPGRQSRDRQPSSRFPLRQRSCSRPSCLARSSASAATIATMPPSSATKFPKSRCSFSKRRRPSSLPAERSASRRNRSASTLKASWPSSSASAPAQIGPDEDVRPYIRGYTIVNDVTARDLQKSDGQWSRAKGFDTFCPVGPIVTDEIDPAAGVTVETRLNGEVRQHGNTRDLIFPIAHLLRYITAAMTLYARRLDPHRNPRRRRPHAARRPRRGRDRRHRNDSANPVISRDTHMPASNRTMNHSPNSHEL